MNKRVIFTLGGKGGIGKTFAMVSLGEYLGYHKVPHVIIDCDIENKVKGSISCFFENVRKVDPRKPDGLDVFIDVALEGTSPIVIADLAANTGVDVKRWFAEMYSASNKRGISFLALAAVTANPGSLETVFTWANFLGGKVDYLICRNLFQGDVPLWDTGETAKRFKETFKPAEITLATRIPEWQTELENHGMTLSKAMDSKHPMFSLASAQIRLESMRNQTFSEFDSVREILVPQNGKATK